MQESKRQIGQKLATIMKADGYRKRSITWFKQQPDTILVFHGEKNRWGANRYSFSCGIYLTRLGDNLAPPISRCHIQADLEDLVPDKFECRQVSDFDYQSFTLHERLAKITEYVAMTALPWLNGHSTLFALQEVARNYENNYPRIRILYPVLLFLQN
jgi:hypothetical protein